LTIGSSSTYKIIGQPIRLADLLLAIDLKDAQVEFYTSNKYFCFSIFNSQECRTELLAEYNLSKDDIMLQSDEFCEFAYKLIK